MCRGMTSPPKNDFLGVPGIQVEQFATEIPTPVTICPEHSGHRMLIGLIADFEVSSRAFMIESPVQNGWHYHSTEKSIRQKFLSREAFDIATGFTAKVQDTK